MHPFDQPNTRDGFRFAKAIVTEHLHGNNQKVADLLTEMQEVNDPQLSAADRAFRPSKWRIGPVMNILL